MGDLYNIHITKSSCFNPCPYLNFLEYPSDLAVGFAEGDNSISFHKLSFYGKIEIPFRDKDPTSVLRNKRIFIFEPFPVNFNLRPGLTGAENQGNPHCPDQFKRRTCFIKGICPRMEQCSVQICDDNYLCHYMKRIVMLFS